jgi:hypothetical protein
MRIEMRQDGQEVTGGVRSSVAVEVVLTVNIEQPSPKLQVGFELLDSDGVEIFQTFHTDAASLAVLPAGVHQLSCSMPAGLLNAGHYVIRPLAALFCEKWLVSRADSAALHFDVALDHSQSEMWYQPRSGVLALSLEWRQALLPGTALEHV